MDEQQSNPGLLRRLGSGVDEAEHVVGGSDAAAPAMAFGQLQDVLHLEFGGASQRVDLGNRVQRISAGEVESRAGRRRDDDVPKGLNFIGGIPIGPRFDSLGRAAVSVEDLCGRIVEIHSAPWSAAAEQPASTPRRPDQSHAALARVKAVNGVLAWM